MTQKRFIRGSKRCPFGPSSVVSAAKQCDISRVAAILRDRRKVESFNIDLLTTQKHAQFRTISMAVAGFKTCLRRLTGRSSTDAEARSTRVARCTPHGKARATRTFPMPSRLNQSMDVISTWKPLSNGWSNSPSVTPVQSGDQQSQARYRTH